MRMWMTEPAEMCRQHLLGEHVELHMLVGSIARRRSIRGFIDDGLVEPQSIVRRHAALVREMSRRGYRHRSPLRRVRTSHLRGDVDRRANKRELARRCAECRRLQRRGK